MSGRELLGSAAFFLAMPGMALFAEGSSTTFPVVVVVGEVTSWLGPPAGEARLWRMQVLHFNSQGLYLLK
jgi:hypothetical protein